MDAPLIHWIPTVFPTNIWILSVYVKWSNFNDLADSELLIDSDLQGIVVKRKRGGLFLVSERKNRFQPLKHLISVGRLLLEGESFHPQKRRRAADQGGLLV